MSFSESVIIPLSLFKACQLTDINKDANHERRIILEDEELPVEKKMLLYNQQQIKATKDQTESVSKQSSDDRVQDDILININAKYRPQIKLILEIIRENPDIVSFDETTFEVIINGKIIENSNIIDILKDFTKNSVITKESDVSKGVVDLYDALVNTLNIPKSWIPLIVQKPRRSKRKRNQSNKKSNISPFKKKTRQTSSSEQPEENQQSGGWIIY